jgi:hypothetical protein
MSRPGAGPKRIDRKLNDVKDGKLFELGRSACLGECHFAARGLRSNGSVEQT